MSAVLAAHDLHTYLGASYILQGVSLEVTHGEAVALLGRNGAGKTTTLRTLLGLAPPSRGAITLDGASIVGMPAHEIARRGISLMPQGKAAFAPLTVRENLLLGARPGRWTVERVLDTFPRLRQRLDQYAGGLSGGERQMLALGRALLMNGKVLLLDEPSAGLSPLLVEEIGRVIKAVRDEQRVGIVLVEQNAGLAFEIATRVYVMNKGRIVHSGPTEELVTNELLKHRYLGVA